MLGDGCDDWNVYLGIASVPERIESSREGGHISRIHQSEVSDEADSESDRHHSYEQCHELRPSHACAGVLHRSYQLKRIALGPVLE